MIQNLLGISALPTSLEAVVLFLRPREDQEIF